MSDPRDRHPSPSAGVVLLGLLLGLLLGACAPSPSAPVATSTPSPGPTAAPSPTESAPPSESPSPVATAEETGPVAAACEVPDLKVSHGLVEGTAGSRETEVILVTAVRCALPAWPTFGLRDGNGTALVAGVPGGGGQTIVEPGGSYASEIQFANWCDAEPAYPVTLELRLGGASKRVTGGSFPEEGDMPPCTAAALPMLSATAWAPSS